MASLHKKGGHLYAVFRTFSIAKGRRIQSWLRCPDDNDLNKAQKFADEMEAVSQRFSGGIDLAPVEKTEIIVTALRYLCRIHSTPYPGEMIGEGPPFAEFAKDWLARKAQKTKPATLALYRTVVKAFTRYTGHNGEVPMGTISPPIAQKFYDQLLEERAAVGTAKNHYVVIKAIFARAHDLGHITRNPFAAVEIRSLVQEERAVFSAEEEKKLFDYLEQLGGSWHTASMLARWAGLRLGDAANLKWSNVVDVDGIKSLNFVPQKKDRPNVKAKPVIVPLLPVLRNHIETLVPGHEFLCPDLAGRDVGGRVGLSYDFMSILALVGIDRQEVARVQAKRKFYRLGFHSLRGTFVTWMESQNIPVDVRMVMSDHSDEAVHRRYLHMSVGRLQEAFNQIQT